MGWVFGYAIIPGLAFLLKNFRYMQLCSVIIMTFMMIWFYFFYESPRWQLTNGQIDRAEITIRKALKQNGKSDKNLKEQLNQLTAHLQRVKYSLVSLK
jgi:OCT family organic cation transporter-like MFS transporter 4/5